jgi:hypothetical protein
LRLRIGRLEQCRAVSAEPLQQHFPGGGIEVNVDAALASQAGAHHEALLASTFSATSQFSLPTVGRDASLTNKKHIAAPEQLDLDLVAARAQRIELPGQIANREVHIAAARATAQLPAALPGNAAAWDGRARPCPAAEPET